MSIANPQNGVVWSKEEQASKLGAVAEVIVCHLSQLIFVKLPKMKREEIGRKDEIERSRKLTK